MRTLHMHRLLACSLLVSTLFATTLHAQTTTLTQDGTANVHDQTPIVAMDTDSELSEQLVNVYKSLGDSYIPRTEHLFDDGSPVYINRLIDEDSPYLRQHAHNPVNWYPWGDEAFAVAKLENKPIFLSIGYATCHWCHVMERESFENIVIANKMNDHYISIKVDREQLPDVDALFMTAVMMINGSGGWPMSSFLDTDGRPFYGATYFRPDQFNQLLGRIADLWQSEPETLLAQAAQVSTAINRVNDTSAEAQEVGAHEIERALSDAITRFDSENGGFGGAPKFPREPTLYFLLDQAQRTNAKGALKVADETLKHMAAGGIHDQVGGGFHRYAVDSSWLVPHFEKMLYNQAALARNYAQAYQLTGDPAHYRTATRILDYVLRDMTSPNGTFYSATDADSAGEEGSFFVWTPEELESVLGESDAQMAKRVWNVTGEGNFEGTSILHTSNTLAELATTLELSEQDLLAKIDSWSEPLRLAREQREHPLRDEKVLSSWNGMMISALAEGSDRLNNKRYLKAAERAADAIWADMHKGNGELYRSYFNARASIEGTQADYAYLAEGYLALYDINGNKLWLDRAKELIETMNEKFWDLEHGAYFMGGSVVSGASLSSRPKDLGDNSIASGNSVALRVLARMFKRTGVPRYEALANQLISALSSRIAEQPAGYYYLLTGVSEHLNGERGNQQYGGRGVVKSTARIEQDKLVVSIALADGWHINSDQPLQDYLIPTRLTLADGQALQNVIYPQAITRKLGFQQSKLSLFENRIDLIADLPPSIASTDDQKSERYTEINLQLQACNDKTCLAPETLPLLVFE